MFIISFSFILLYMLFVNRKIEIENDVAAESNSEYIDYSSQENFSTAFDSASANGDIVFIWNGGYYTTEREKN